MSFIQEEISLAHFLDSVCTDGSYFDISICTCAKCFCLETRNGS